MTQKIVKVVYIIMDGEKIVSVYRREDRAYSVSYLLASRNPDKTYSVTRAEVL